MMAMMTKAERDAVRDQLRQAEDRCTELSNSYPADIIALYGAMNAGGDDAPVIRQLLQAIHHKRFDRIDLSKLHQIDMVHRASAARLVEIIFTPWVFSDLGGLSRDPSGKTILTPAQIATVLSEAVEPPLARKVDAQLQYPLDYMPTRDEAAGAAHKLMQAAFSYETERAHHIRHLIASLLGCRVPVDLAATLGPGSTPDLRWSARTLMAYCPSRGWPGDEAEVRNRLDEVGLV